MRNQNSNIKCYAPWHALSIRANGAVYPDCVYRAPIGNLSTDTLSTILSSNESQSLKESILNGQLPPNCESCISKEKIHNHSRRIFFNQILNPLITSPTNNSIHFLELNLSNVCNLKCRMCSGINSTAWVKEDIKLSKNSKLQRPIHHDEFGYNTVPYDLIKNLFDDTSFFKELRYLNIKGGEPYQEPTNKIILKKLIDLNIAKNITLDISTNGTILDDEFDELAMQFKETKWHVSFEGTKGLYEYIRGGNNFTFEEFEHNLNVFSKFDRVILAGTVLTYNVSHLHTMYCWFQHMKRKNFEFYISNVVAQPYYLNPCVLPDEILDGTNYKSLNNPDSLNAFIEFTSELDSIRNTNVLDVCPELHTLFS